MQENAFVIVTKGKKIIFHDEKILEVNNNQILLLKKGVYTMTEYLAEDGFFEAIVIYFNKALIRQANLLLNSIHQTHWLLPEMLILDKNGIMDSFVTQYFSYIKENENIDGISLSIYGYNNNTDSNLIFGVVIACLGLFQIFQRYKLSYVFAIIPILLVVVGLAGTFIFILIYFPFFYKESLNLDLGALIIKDWFVRLLIIIFDVLLLINVVANIRKRIKTKSNNDKEGEFKM